MALLVAALVFVKKLLAVLAGQEAGHGGHRSMPEADEMVQDPVCKVYVPMSRSVTVKSGGETLYFCSEDCAHKYVEGKGGRLKRRG